MSSKLIKVSSYSSKSASTQTGFNQLLDAREDVRGTRTNRSSLSDSATKHVQFIPFLFGQYFRATETGLLSLHTDGHLLMGSREEERAE